MNQLNKNLLRLKLPNNMIIEPKEEHIFPDSHNEKPHLNERMYLLKTKEQDISIFKFGFCEQRLNKRDKQKSNILTIEFIQGIKQKNNEKLPKKWAETVMNAFVYASIPIKKTNPDLKIMHRDFIPYVNGSSRIIERERRIKRLKKEREVAHNKGGNKKRIEYLDKEINIELNRKRLVGALRDRYFTKEGHLNFQKKRIKQVYKVYEKNQKIKRLRRKLKIQKIQKQKNKYKIVKRRKKIKPKQRIRIKKPM